MKRLVAALVSILVMALTSCAGTGPIPDAYRGDPIKEAAYEECSRQAAKETGYEERSWLSNILLPDGGIPLLGNVRQMVSRSRYNSALEKCLAKKAEPQAAVPTTVIVEPQTATSAR